MRLHLHPERLRTGAQLHCQDGLCRVLIGESGQDFPHRRRRGLGPAVVIKRRLGTKGRMSPVARVTGLLQEIAAAATVHPQVAIAPGGASDDEIAIEDRADVDQAAIEQKRGRVVDTQHPRTTSRRRKPGHAKQKPPAAYVDGFG